MGDEDWLDKLDAATAGDSATAGDVRLSVLEERMARERAPLAPVQLNGRHRPAADVEPAPGTEADGIGKRFARIEALLLDLAHRVDRFADQHQQPPPPVGPTIEELQTIEVGVRAAARVILRSSDELSAVLATMAERPVIDVRPIDVKLDEVIRRMDRLAATIDGIDQRLGSMEHRLGI